MEEQNKHAVIQATKAITAKRKQRILQAPGIHDIRANVPFQILVTNFSKKPMVLPKPMRIGLDTGPPRCTRKPGQSEGLKPTVEVNTVPQKKV